MEFLRKVMTVRVQGHEGKKEKRLAVNREDCPEQPREKKGSEEKRKATSSI